MASLIPRRFNKIEKYHEKSWNIQLYRGHNITPEPMHQGLYPTCVFYSVAKGAQMEIHRQYADLNRPCDIVTDPEAMVSDFLFLNTIKAKDMGNFEKEWMPRIDAVIFIGQHFGISATSSGWEGPRWLKLEKIVDLGDSLHHDDLAELLDAGRPVLAILIVEPLFGKLGEDELYCCTPEYTKEGYLRRPFGYHMVVLVGHGDHGEPITFLNSSGKLFGNGGFGHAKLEDFVAFFKIEIKCRPPIIARMWPDSTSSKQHARLNLDAQRWRLESSPPTHISKWKQPAHHSRADAASSWYPEVAGPSLARKLAYGERKMAEITAKTMEKPELKQKGDEAFEKQDYANSSCSTNRYAGLPSECKNRKAQAYREGKAWIKLKEHDKAC